MQLILFKGIRDLLGFTLLDVYIYIYKESKDLEEESCSPLKKSKGKPKLTLI